MNKNIFSDTYSTYFQSNAATIYLYKSNRKNAKIVKSISINHLITQKQDRKIPDGRIIEQFVDTLSYIVDYSEKRHLEITVYSDVFKKVVYKNANGDNYHTTKDLQYNFYRVKFASIEQCINFLFTIYSLIYPYNTIDLNTGIYQNTSIKYFINKFYQNKGV